MTVLKPCWMCSCISFVWRALFYPKRLIKRTSWGSYKIYQTVVQKRNSAHIVALSKLTFQFAMDNWNSGQRNSQPDLQINFSKLLLVNQQFGLINKVHNNNANPATGLHQTSLAQTELIKYRSERLMHVCTSNYSIHYALQFMHWRLYAVHGRR
jgi:hypothetical protein